MLRRYQFPPSGETDQDLAARIEHSGLSFYFPLGTPDPEVAAQKARAIHELIAKQGWSAAGQQFSRELIVAFEWCLQPVLWTYTTIHTLVGDRALPESGAVLPSPQRQRVLVVELDAGIRQALCWSINQQPGFCSVPCATVDAYAQSMASHPVQMVLLNRNLAGRLGIENPGCLAAIRPDVPAITYSVYADGDQMFVATPGGAEGYLVKRVKPDHLLDPIINVASRQEVLKENLLAAGTVGDVSTLKDLDISFQGKTADLKKVILGFNPKMTGLPDTLNHIKPQWRNLTIVLRREPTQDRLARMDDGNFATGIGDRLDEAMQRLEILVVKPVDRRPRFPTPSLARIDDYTNSHFYRYGNPDARVHCCNAVSYPRRLEHEARTE